MREIDRIRGQLRSALEANAWHGPALLETLSDVTADEARARPSSGAHSIWELVLHITVWVRTGISGATGKRFDVPDDVDWRAPGEDSRAAWEEAIRDMKEAHRELDEVLSRTKDESLEQEVVGRDYTLYKLLHGVIQHDLYHAGQIALLKKLWRSVQKA